jgi:hypothetical protein
MFFYYHVIRHHPTMSTKQMLQYVTVPISSLISVAYASYQQNKTSDIVSNILKKNKL